MFKNLCELEWLAPECQDKMQEDTLEELMVLEQSELGLMLAEMEDAAYVQDGEHLQEMVVKLQNYQYQGNALAELVVPVLKKIEKADYISAVEMIERILNKLTDKEG